MKTIIKKRIIMSLLTASLLLLPIATYKPTVVADIPVFHEIPSTLSILRMMNQHPTATAVSHAREIVTTGINFGTEYPIENGNCIKTYEPYKCFAEWSNQYKLQQIAETNEYGLRMIDNRYLVAVGTYFDMKIGQMFNITLENGTVIPCIMGDEKADEHTDENGLFTVHSNCMAEFIVSTKDLPELARKMGNVSYAVDGWNSKIVSVTVFDENVLKQTE